MTDMRTNRNSSINKNEILILIISINEKGWVS